MSEGWLGVDLDGTLAHYDGWRGVDHIGEPIRPMVQRVRGWLEEGRCVKIFTARASVSYLRSEKEAERAKDAIELWCLQHIGKILEITNVKDFSMIELWDDRCVQVTVNSGLPVIGSTSRLK